MRRIIILASAVLASTQAQAVDCQPIDSRPRCWEQQRALEASEETNRQLGEIADQIRRLRQQQQWDAPLLDERRIDSLLRSQLDGK